MRILIAEPEGFSRDAIRQLSSVARVDCRRLQQRNLAEALETYDVVWIRLHLRVRQVDIPDRVRCRFVISATTGLDHIDEPAVAHAGMKIISLRGRRGFLRGITATAEHTIGLILALTRNVIPAVASVKRGEWNRNDYIGRDLSAMTAGIVGYGRLGSQVARILCAMRMRVLAYDPLVSIRSNRVKQVDSMRHLLSSADIVTLHVPYNDETHHLLSRRTLAWVKSGAQIINTSRADVIDEKALLALLKSGHVAGAALDVLSGEPSITSRHPLVAYSRMHNNLLITPHIGGATRDAMARCEEYLAGRLAEKIKA